MIEQPPPVRVVVPCGCAGCRKAAAHIIVREGRLMVEIRSKHNGMWHTSYLTVDDGQSRVQVSATSPSGE